MVLIQEGPTVSWDPSSVWINCGPDRSLELVTWTLPYCFAIYLCWHPLRLLAKWRHTRYVLPTIMLAIAILAIVSPDTIPIALNHLR
ncbi:MAG TPA: hypothetical protein VKE70_06870 [Candidatus Solibacter sp.]|nr:hypothetical protein [Candidatus Solibacter sp.]